MNDLIKITFNDFSSGEFPKGSAIKDIAKSYETKMDNPIIGAKINNVVTDFDSKIVKDANISFFDVNDINGYKMYQAGLKFILIVALKELYGPTTKVVFEHSIDKGVMCEITNGKPITSSEITEIIARMKQIVSEDLPFEKITVSKKEAIKFYETKGELEKATNIQNAANPSIIFYKLKNEYNFFYVDMPPRTGVLAKFDLISISENKAVLMFPSPRSNNEVPQYTHHEKIVEVFKNDKAWLEKMNATYISDFNKQVGSKNISEFIRMNEMVFNNKVYNIGDEIIAKPNIKIILIAGPSSSGKTTTTKKLSMYLKSFGVKVLMVSVDDYFKERVDTPKDEKGEYDFESLDAIDIELFNKQLLDLVHLKPVCMPRFDFINGKKTYSDKETVIDENTVLLIEGLHCLNEELTKDISKDVKYKIYLSPFTPLSIDSHNHISTVDSRLIRRLVRDNRTRGFDVSNTIANWQKVRSGEENYIFPYIPEADTVLNTAFVYEMGVLRVYAEPLLFSVSVTSPYYEEARRLLGFLRIFFPIPSEYTPDDSILREFIGHGFFEK